MRKLIFIIFFFYTTNSLAEKLNLPDISENPIFAYENSNAKVNIIAFVGGGGIKKGVGKSQNPLAREREAFKNAGTNYYIFPNPKKNKKIEISYRKSKDHIEKIKKLIDYLRLKNNLPIILVGHSRGSVSVAAATNSLGLKNIKGSVIMGSITETSSAVSSSFIMKTMFKNKPDVPILVIHHEKDACVVTPYTGAKGVADKHNFKLIKISGGGSSGDVCGPLHYHGFEDKMTEVIQSIKEWSEKL